MTEADTRAPNQVWNAWNSRTREQSVEARSERHAAMILGWLEAIGRRDLQVLDCGCGAGWLSARMQPFGQVTAVDLADEVLTRAQARWPAIQFRAGDFFEMDLPEASFDVVTSLEVLSHVPDQAGYVGKIARLLKPGGALMMATQNRPVLELNKLPPPDGWIRDWVDRDELRALLAPHFDVVEMTTVEPQAKEGALRWLAAWRVMSVMNAVTFGGYKAALEHVGLGWSIMCLARKRD